jgi:3-hydroxybutyrate dehydrogenase
MFLKEKRALVTGSTSGIGLAIARSLAGAGAQVVVNGFGDPDAIARIVAELSDASGAQASFVGADLSKRPGVEEMMAAAGEVDILVNNAGMQHVAPIEEFPVDKWDMVIALNLTAVFDAVRLAVPHMKRRNWGRIITTGSAHSLTASPFKAAYVSAKHGLAGLTKTLALELAETNITANMISPGYVWTPLVENQIPDTMAARGMTREQVINEVMLERQPSKRFVQPEDVAELALFLCREAAGNITGANYNIDGGWVAQ